jgi:RNA recognition motif-containing protein
MVRPHGIINISKLLLTLSLRIVSLSGAILFSATAKILSRLTSVNRKVLFKMATNIFVGKLSYNTTDETLREFFAKHGTVASAQVIKDRDSGSSKGFAFVEMPNAEEAQAAIKALDGQELDGRTIAVSVAKPREERPRSDRPSFGGNFQRRR